MSTTAHHDVRDLGLSADGVRRIEWADRQMPVLASIRERFAAERPLDGHPHLRLPARHQRDREPDAHAEGRRRRRRAVRVQPAVDAGRRRRGPGGRVRHLRVRHQRRGQRHLLRAHRGGTRPPARRSRWTTAPTSSASCTPRRRDQLGEIIGGTEETTTGVIRLKAMERRRHARLPDRRRQRGRHQAPVRQPLRHRPVDHRRHLRATNVLLAGRTFVVGGYGWCGRGLADRARGMGAHVIVVEVDPLRALQAVMDGFRGDADGRGRPRSATSSSPPPATRT